jgi:hypothetical protein
MSNYTNLINPVFEKLILDLLKDMPEDFVKPTIKNKK